MGQRTRFESAREQLRYACAKGWLARYEVRPIPTDGGPLVGDPFTVWFNNGLRWSCSLDVAIALTKGLRVGVAIRDGKAVRPTERPACTGASAAWCPVHGDCSCPTVEGPDPYARDLDAHDCPLHGPNSSHASKRLEGDPDAQG